MEDQSRDANQIDANTSSTQSSKRQSIAGLTLTVIALGTIVGASAAMLSGFPHQVHPEVGTIAAFLLFIGGDAAFVNAATANSRKESLALLWLISGVTAHGLTFIWIITLIYYH